MNKILKIFSITVIVLFFLSLYGWMVSHMTKGDKNFGFITETIKFMYTFPDLFSQSVEEVKTLPETFVPTPESFEPVNNLDSDCLALSAYSDSNDLRSIVLLNLKNDSVLYKWTVENPYLENERIVHPLLLPEKALLISFDGMSGFIKLDSLSNIVWKQDSIKPHHAKNLDEDGNIWICSFVPVFYATAMYKINGRSVFYVDNYITKVDAKTGDILFHKSVTEILEENNLSGYLLKSPNVKDPIHINDVQPALKSTPYYKDDDLFISARNLSLIMHYRPSTNKVIDIIEGPFACQHDVDFINDSTLAFFNNNSYTLWSDDSKKVPNDSSRLEIAGSFYSNIVFYDFTSEDFSFFGDSIFRENKIYSHTEGIMDFIDSSTFFVEEQNPGIIWILNEDSVIYKNVLTSQHVGYHHLPNWIRIIEKYE